MHQRIHTAFAIAALLIVLTACGTTASTNTGVAVTATSAPASTPTTAPTSHFKVGQLVSVGGIWQVTIVSVTTSTGSQFVQPQKPGDIFLIIAVKLKNISSADQAISPYNFVLRDATGQQYNDTYLDGIPAEPSGNIAAGAPVAGSLPYEVPKALHNYVYAFQSNLFAGGQTTWDLTV